MQILTFDENGEKVKRFEEFFDTKFYLEMLENSKKRWSEQS